MTHSEHDNELIGYLDTSDAGDAVQVAQAQRMRSAVADQPVVGPEAGFFDQALDVAAREGSRDRRRHARSRSWGIGLGSALAAGIAVWLVSGVLLKTPQLDRTDSMPGLTMAMNETRTVNLMFASADALEEATLVVQLPPGVEVAGYAGRSEIRWSTQMQQGKNVLPLALVATEGNGGELVARVEHGSKQKTFRLNINVI